MSAGQSQNARRVAVGLGAIGLTLAFALWLWLGRTPQIGHDPEVVKAVDALFTALTSRNKIWLAQSEDQLRALREANRLPPDASDYLDRVIQTARAGDWRRAARRLFGFIKSQRLPSESENAAREAGTAVKTIA